MYLKTSATNFYLLQKLDRILLTFYKFKFICKIRKQKIDCAFNANKRLIDDELIKMW